MKINNEFVRQEIWKIYILQKLMEMKLNHLQIKGIFIEGNPNTSFELEEIGEVRLIKQDLNNCCYDYEELKQLLLDDDIDIDEDIEEDDLFE